MAKKSPKPPAAPDPVATAKAQTEMNKETAIANAILGNVDQYTPYGNLTYTQTGGNPVYNEEAYAKAMDAYTKAFENYRPTETVNRFGSRSSLGVRTTNAAMPQAPKREDFLISKGDVPKFTSKITLSPEQQRLLDLTQQGDIGTAQLGLDQLGRISQAVSTPFSFAGLPSYGETDQTAAAARAEEALMARMNPQFQRDEEALRSRLINQGIGQGSQAYQREMESFNQARNDARTQAILSGQQFGSRELADALMRRNQGIQEYTTQRNAPLNEYIALTSGTQIQNPQFSPAGSGGIAPVDYTGLVNNAYEAQLGQYNTKVANRNATAGMIGQLGAMALGSFLGPAGAAAAGGAAGAFNPAAAANGLPWSDIKLKNNIKYIGEQDGHKMYEFSYNHAPDKKYIGVMAQDVEKYMPEAVHEIDGFKAVNYDMLGLEMREVL